jgi:uncharacterized protein (TIGR03435 family)
LNVNILKFCLAAALAAGDANVAHLLAQTADSVRPSFEVASIKQNKSGSTSSGTRTQPGGRFTATNVPLRLLIREAYRLQDYQLVDAPDWTRTERFDITAKADGDLEYGQLPLMVQSLLAERFSLVVHRETREMPVYGLVMSRSDGRLGPQLVKSEIDCTDPARRRPPVAPDPAPAASQTPPFEPCSTNANTSGNAATLRVGSMPMSSLAATLSNYVNRIVVDRTGLAGGFDALLTWSPNQTIESSGASIFTAVQEQLGLKLESQRGTVEVLVIDRVEQPTPD